MKIKELINMEMEELKNKSQQLLEERAIINMIIKLKKSEKNELENAEEEQKEEKKILR